MDDLISEFITETSENLLKLEAEIARLKQNPANEELLGNIFQLVHTIKGTCGFLGLPRLESIAHAVENALTKIHGNKIEATSEIAQAIIDSIHHIASLINYLEAEGAEPEGDDRELIARLNNVTVKESAETKPEQESKRNDKVEAKKNENLALEKAVGKTKKTPLKTIPFESLEIGNVSEGQGNMPQSAILAEGADNVEQIIRNVRANMDILRRLTHAGEISMDVVSKNIEKIGGSIETNIQSETKNNFYIKIPFTHTAVSVLIVEVEKQRFAIPQSAIVELLQSSKKLDYEVERINEISVLRIQNRLLPLMVLNEILQISPQGTPQEKESGQSQKSECIVVCKIEGYEFGLVVDRVFDIKKIAIKPVAPILQDVDVYTGCAVDEDEGAMLILNPNGLAKRIKVALTGAKENIAMPLKEEKKSVRQIDFLAFKNKNSEPRLVALEQVRRLERINPDIIEYTNAGIPFLRYKGEFVRIASLGGAVLKEIKNKSGKKSPINPHADSLQIIMLRCETKTIGLIVDEIMEIIKAPEDKENKGTVMFKDQVADILNIAELFANMPESETEQKDMKAA